MSQQEFDDQHVAVLREMVCNSGSAGAASGQGIARNWISKDKERREFNAKLAVALLGEDGKPCASAKHYDESTKTLLREAGGPPPAAPASAPK
jgi:hypothetical protein